MVFGTRRRGAAGCPAAGGARWHAGARRRAAPGGKTTHLAELAALDLVALDVDAARVERGHDNLARLGLAARLIVADAGEPDTWWDGDAFDRILADVPCTASGIVRRHPDGKWLRRETDIAGFVAQQIRLLDALWPCLKHGGVLLYSTCSIFGAENDDQIAAFLRRHGMRCAFDSHCRNPAP
jgi:16S rRNA (cytosine967-C5)-methyltransferase